MTSNGTDIYNVKSLQVVENHLDAVLHIPTDLIYFDGHFDEMSVLPGVVQVHWAIEMAKEHFKISSDFSAIEVLKFMRVIQPDEIVNLQMEYDDSKKVMNFTYKSSPEITHSKGKVKFSA